MPRRATRHALPGRARASSRQHALGGLDLVVDAARPRRSRRSSTRTSSSRRSSSPTTTASTAATWRSTRAILSLLALQAPVAGDLRVVAALLHVIKHVERMGDQCVNIAKLIPLSGHEPPVREELLTRLLQMGRARALGGRAGQAAFADARRRAGRGPRPPGPGDQPPQPRDLPARHRGRRRPRHARVGDAHDLVARALERIGDNAVDIGEQTAFVVTGLFREFSDSSHPKARSALRTSAVKSL